MIKPEFVFSYLYQTITSIESLATYPTTIDVLFGGIFIKKKKFTWWEFQTFLLTFVQEYFNFGYYIYYVYYLGVETRQTELKTFVCVGVGAAKASKSLFTNWSLAHFDRALR